MRTCINFIGIKKYRYLTLFFEVVFFRFFRFLWTAHSGVQQLIKGSSTRLRNLWRHPTHLRVPGCCQLRLSASTRAEQTQQDHPHRQGDSS